MSLVFQPSLTENACHYACGRSPHAVCAESYTRRTRLTVRDISIIFICGPVQLTVSLMLCMSSIIRSNPLTTSLSNSRVEWIAHSLNTPSQNAALRLGYTHEGLLRYHWRLDPSKEGSCKIEGDDWPVRHNWIGSVTVHDWNEEGKREHLKKLMDREVVLK